MFKRANQVAAIVGVGLLVIGASAQAAPILVAGPSPVAPFGGTVIDFEGHAEGTLISNQYAGLGVTFGQDDGGTPQIDNLPMLFGYGAGSGVGVLTGSTNGGAPFPTVAGLRAFFTTPVADAGAFMSDTAPLAGYTITAFGAGMAVLESFVVPAASFPGAAVCGSTLPAAPGCGVFVGFSRPTSDIFAIQFGPSQTSGDAFAIDDFRFSATQVPEPATLLLLGLGALAVARRRF